EWRDFYGVQFDVKLPDDGPVQLIALIRIPDQPVRLDYVTETNATVNISGAGWHRVTLPWPQFDFHQGQPAFLKFVHELHLKASSSILLDNVRLVRASSVALQCDVRGKAAKDRETVEYNVTVSNCTDQPQAIALAMQKHGWEAMPAQVEPAMLSLAPDESK